jgi:hypothetical protein
VFTPQERRAVRDSLVARSRDDATVTAAALVGSAATGHEDRWSDIDLMLRLAPGLEPTDVAAVWTAWMYAEHEVAVHHDVWSRPTLFRVFLTRASLQVDVSFWPDDEFGARADGFELLHGETNPPRLLGPPDARNLAGEAWLYALHVRSALARGRTWQADQLVNALRDRIVQLACLRAGLRTSDGRGVDRLDPAWLQRLAGGRADQLSGRELARAFDTLLDLLQEEVKHVDHDLSHRLDAPLRELRVTE